MLNNVPNKPNNREVIAIIPCAGRASRLPSITCSKELYPIGSSKILETGQSVPKPVGLYLLEKFKAASINKAYLILRNGKWDIPAFFDTGSSIGLDLGYLMMGLPHGTAYTINQAYPFVKHANVAIGFPDILFSPDNAYTQILNSLSENSENNADVMLGLFPADKPEKVDMVKFDANNNVLNIVIKPKQTDLRYTWGIAVWTPVFTQFLYDYLSDLERHASDAELFIGEVIQAAISNGLKVNAEIVSQSPFLDIGTPDDLRRAEAQFR